MNMRHAIFTGPDARNTAGAELMDDHSDAPGLSYREVPPMKSTILLAAALFLISAPAPDSGDIAEITSNFIVPEEAPGLSAAEGHKAGASVQAREKPAATIVADDKSVQSVLPGTPGSVKTVQPARKQPWNSGPDQG
jgi:hypothetical protein